MCELPAKLVLVSLSLTFQASIFDSSFENELWNQSGSAKLLLLIDFKHPDLTPEDDFLHPSHWNIQQVDGKFLYQMKEFVS